MPRYFLNVNARRPFEAAGRSFEFEPVGLRGGSWLGILALEDDSLATILSSHGGDGVDEISADYYDSLKKKLSAGPNNSPASNQHQPVQPFAPVVAEPAVRPTAQRAVEVKSDPHAGLGLTPVSLLATDRAPPAEPILEAGRQKRRF